MSCNLSVFVFFLFTHHFCKRYVSIWISVSSQRSTLTYFSQYVNDTALGRDTTGQVSLGLVFQRYSRILLLRRFSLNVATEWLSISGDA